MVYKNHFVTIVMICLQFVSPSSMARCTGTNHTEYQVENGWSLITVPDGQDPDEAGCKL